VTIAPDTPPGVARVVVLGASNVARGLPVIVDTARHILGGPCRFLVACGHGRSYGVKSRFIVRKIDSIVASPLWGLLDDAEDTDTSPVYALLTDVGNDVVYGIDPQQTLAWVETCLQRLCRHSDRVVITGLPMSEVRRLSRFAFRLARMIHFPGTNVGYDFVIDASETIDAGLRALADAHGATFVNPQPTWYGVDPIHIRPRRWPDAFAEMLGGWDERERETPTARASLLRSARWLAMAPDKRWVLGREQRGQQPARTLLDSSTIELY